jgi:hypothetical protein
MLSLIKIIVVRTEGFAHSPRSPYYGRVQIFKNYVFRGMIRK